jgi:7-cyano-7-deazaguanine reductase
LWSFRNEGVFHEHVTNIILEDLVAALRPRWCRVSAEFAVRGGIAIKVEAEYPDKKNESEKQLKGSYAKTNGH